MKTYNNVFIHKLLDRQKAVELLLNWLMPPNFEKELPPVVSLEDEKASKGTNAGEVSLFNILKKEGFPDFEEQKVIKIGPPYDRTLPDLYYEDEDEDIMEIEVVSIAVSDLDDPEALNKCLRKIARKIGKKDLQKKYK